MPRNVLVVGEAGLLASYLAASLLLSTDDSVFFDIDCARGPFSDDELATLVQHAIRQVSLNEHLDSFEGRLHRPIWESNGAQTGLSKTSLGETLMSEVWYVSGGHGWPPGLSALLRILPQLGATELNYVRYAYVVGDPVEVVAAERNVIEQCEANGVDFRIFHVSLIIGPDPPLKGLDREGFLQFLWNVHDLKREIEERLPEYFEYQALRCLAHVDASLNMIRVDQAVEMMLDLARRPSTIRRSYNIGGPENIPFADICDRAGMVYGLSLLPVDDTGSLNAIDRAFAERLDGFQACLTEPCQPACGETYRALDLDPDRLRLDDETQTRLFEAVCHSQEAGRAARNQRVTAMNNALERKSVDRGGSELIYFAGGSGKTPIVLVNALGQGLHYWYRLIDNLTRRHRVLIWEPRGIEATHPPLGVSDQVDDVESVLQQEGADKCYLVAWCTGPKIAIEFYLRRPSAVLSMAFLNSAFKCLGGPPESDTPYERNFEPLCRILESRPNMAASIMKSLQSSVDDSKIDLMEETDNELLSVNVLSLMNRDMKDHVKAPFRSESVLLNYSRQILDFWSCDTQKNAEQVQIPVLFVATEYDKVASPDASRAVARHFPMARYVEVKGATHYCLYDRPDFMAEMIEGFFRNPHGVNSESGPA